MKTLEIDGSKLELVKGDITKEHVDAIVNAANSGLRGGGGVDGAIHRAGGPAILDACRAIGHCPTGKAVVTTAGNLNARYVIHAVGPVYRGGSRGEASQLRSAYLESLRQASQRGAESVAFPSISTGAYGFPVGEAAHIALTTVRDYLRDQREIRIVRFVLFDDATYGVFEDALDTLA